MPPQNTVLVVRAAEKAEAKVLFGKLGIKIVCGHHFLEGFMGEPEDVHTFVSEKVKFVHLKSGCVLGEAPPPGCIYDFQNDCNLNGLTCKK